MEKHCPDVPIVLVGTKLDLRNDKEYVEKPDSNVIPMEDGIEMQAKHERILAYVECSALSMFGLEKVFEEATRAALRNTRVTSKCSIM